MLRLVHLLGTEQDLGADLEGEEELVHLEEGAAGAPVDEERVVLVQALDPLLVRGRVTVRVRIRGRGRVRVRGRGRGRGVFGEALDPLLQVVGARGLVE